MKAGCDITKGLKESTKLEWTGDVDLNDGSLQEEYKAYRERLTFIETIGKDKRCSNEIIQVQLEKILGYIIDDLKSIHSCKLSNNVV